MCVVASNSNDDRLMFLPCMVTLRYINDLLVFTEAWSEGIENGGREGNNGIVDLEEMRMAYAWSCGLARDIRHHTAHNPSRKPPARAAVKRDSRWRISLWAWNSLPNANCARIGIYISSVFFIPSLRSQAHSFTTVHATWGENTLSFWYYFSVVRSTSNLWLR